MVPTAEEAWQAGARIAKVASFFGVQDAARKRREQTKRPVAWAGVVCGTYPDRPYVSVTTSKWEQTKEEVSQLREGLDQAFATGGDRKMDCKTLEQVAGYLDHVTRAFPTIKVYLNGVYATMNAWRPDCDEEGWKVGHTKIESNKESPAAPVRVQIVPRMKFDIQALEGLTEAADPPERILHPRKHGSRLRYCFGDASGAGLGVSQWSPGDTEIKVDYSAWGDYITRDSLSNYRELGNIVQKIERMDSAGQLNDAVELFIFTDNYHAESAFYQGSAKSPEVVQLMFRLHAF
ncbi:hypothetical protein ACA910_008700 [Epithemia clementina (nom. ined.)]